MTPFEFLQELESFFPLDESDEKIRKRISFYTEILQAQVSKNKKEYNFHKIIQWFLQNYKYKTFPNMVTILEALSQGEIKPQVKCKDEGALVVVSLPNGYTHHFTVSAYGKPMENIKESIKQKFGGGTYKIYPKGTVIIGDKVFLPD